MRVVFLEVSDIDADGASSRSTNQVQCIVRASYVLMVQVVPESFHNVVLRNRKHVIDRAPLQLLITASIAAAIITLRPSITWNITAIRRDSRFQSTHKISKVSSNLLAIAFLRRRNSHVIINPLGASIPNNFSITKQHSPAFRLQKPRAFASSCLLHQFSEDHYSLQHPDRLPPSKNFTNPSSPTDSSQCLNKRRAYTTS